MGSSSGSRNWLCYAYIVVSSHPIDGAGSTLASLLIAFLIGFYTSPTIEKIFECTSREEIWNSTLPGKCVEVKWILNISGGVNTVTDYLILLLPVLAVRGLQLPTTKRIQSC